eukprot:TRINITY_DN12398_c0_g1_i2.p1 TRINITY_DN12398_c0_g1~~TRINITY_DN12398_c0_g1_i2.p1  ORF type:complete len:133 (-),score=27.87 TRINITY_DN12398_c0_g1_i2:417-815(-)
MSRNPKSPSVELQVFAKEGSEAFDVCTDRPAPAVEREAQLKAFEMWKQSSIKKSRRTLIFALCLFGVGFGLLLYSFALYGEGDLTQATYIFAVSLLCGLPGLYQSITSIKTIRKTRYQTLNDGDNMDFDFEE